MKWKINIENEPTIKVELEYKPLENDKVYIYGKGKINSLFTILHIDQMDIEEFKNKTSIFDDILYDVIDKTKEKINNYNIIDEFFKNIKLIEVN